MAKCNKCQKDITWDKVEAEKIGKFIPKNAILVNGVRKLVNHECQTKQDESEKEKQIKWEYIKDRPGYYCGQCLEFLCSLEEGYQKATKQICFGCNRSPAVIEIVSEKLEVIRSKN